MSQYQNQKSENESLIHSFSKDLQVDKKSFYKINIFKYYFPKKKVSSFNKR